MATTIQVSTELIKQLKAKKLYDKESYEEIIRDLLEDGMELSEETKKHIKQSEQDIKAGKTVSLAAVKKRAGI
jgi:RNA polymerase-interacting CarD/CdnL/TRCF family regulator